jgi:glycosyltransferase involved in cell wall biosynthesis
VRSWSMQRAAGFVIAPAPERHRILSRYRVSGDAVAQIFNPVPVPAAPIERSTARRTLSVPPTARVAVWHGRIDIELKGLDVLLQAWRAVTAELGDDAMLLLLGDGKDAPALRTALQDPAFANVRWVDRYTNDRIEIQTVLAAGDVYVFPSRHEGFAVAPLEAMALGLPLVATAVSGIPEVLAQVEGSGGTIVPVGDHVALARELIRLMCDRDLAGELGVRAKRRIEDCFSEAAVGSQLVSFFARRSTP